MRIDIDTKNGGKAVPVLTKTERKSLSEASAICAALVPYGGSGMRTLSDGISELLGKHIDADGKFAVEGGDA